MSPAVALGPEPTVHDSARLRDCRIGPWCRIAAENLLDNVEFGAWSYTGPWSIIQNAEIGKFANLAAMVRIGPTHHPMDRPTLHHFTYRRRMFGLSETDDGEFFDRRRSLVAEIGHDTWIGHGAVVMPGVRVGNGAVVGSGAVVTKDVGDYEIAVGVPAKIVRRRFDEAVSRRLSALAWWDWDYGTIKERLDDFCGPVEAFLEKYE